MRTTLLLTSFLAGCQMTPQQSDELGRMGTYLLSNQSPYCCSSQPYRPSAYYTGESLSGMNKMCFYNRVGSMEAINVGAATSCPLQIP